MAYREHRFTAPDGLGLYYRDYGDPASAAAPVLGLGAKTGRSWAAPELKRRPICDVAEIMVRRKHRKIVPDA